MQREHDTINTLRNRARAAFERFLDIVETVLRERPTMEHALLLLFFVVGIYMYLGASEFAPAAQTFPKLMAGGTAILSFLLLARNYLEVVAPVVGAVLGAYFAYSGGIAFLQDGEGLFRLSAGVALLLTVGVFRTRFGAAVESFVAEPMQVMGEEDSGAPVADETEPDEGDAVEAKTASEAEVEGETVPEAAVEAEAVSEAEVEAETVSEAAVEAETASEAAVEAEAASEAEVEAETVSEAAVDEAETETATEKESGSSAMYVYEIDDPRGPVVTGLLCTGYMILTFVIGMLYATPIFVIAWTLWVGMDAVKASALTALSFVTAYLFYDLIQDDIAEGWLTGWELPPPDDLLDLVISVLHWGVPIV